MARKKPDFYIKSGNTSPKFEMTLTMANGEALPTQNGTFRFRMWRVDGTPVVNNEMGEVFTNEDGATVFRYDWRPEDTAVPGDYLAEVNIVYSGSGDDFTIPNGRDHYWVEIGRSLV